MMVEHKISYKLKFEILKKKSKIFRIEILDGFYHNLNCLIHLENHILSLLFSKS